MAGEIDKEAELIDVCIDQFVVTIDTLEKTVNELKVFSVPQQAAKDKIIEIINGALKPYTQDIAQCMDVFEQGR